MERSFFKNIERKTGVDFDEIMNLANALTYADFSDEKQVRKIVKKVSKLANKPVSSELEEKIVASIIQDGKSLDFSKIEKMMK
ncbi:MULTISPECIES: stage VI sporulation protein F [Solibacillus]|uniref:Stage VI sporulation protein F n=2 Tax=Solibacillus TaxID=648800 RepID=A0ABR8XUP3_9BACL|nr:MULTISPECIES: stage VI sporulation protein F [Solibacillus]MBD8031534.1 stage VI sporulation protein F [Solibacillus merdavium]MBD8035642.1 stage VI sporulation protein F [Solibacillus faecavium]